MKLFENLLRLIKLYEIFENITKILTKSQKIIQCLTLPSLSHQDSTSVLLFFNEYFQLTQIDIVESGVKIFAVATFPLETPISKSFLIGNNVGLITQDNFLLILNSTPPFSAISKFKISDTQNPSTSPTAHLASFEGENANIIILSAFSEKNVKLQIDHEEHLDIQPFQFSDDFIILSSTFTKTANIFAFLISGYDQKRFLIFFDVEKMEEIEREEVPPDSFSIKTSTNIESSLFEIFILTTHSIIKYKGEKIDLPFRLLSAFPLLNGEFIIQTENGSVFGFDPKENKLFKKGKLPIISMFHSIQNNFLLCVSESEDSFIIPFSLKYPVSEPSIKLKLLPRTNLFLYPRMTTAVFQYGSEKEEDHSNTKLVAASGSKIALFSSTIPFSKTKVEDLTQIFNEQITYIDNSVYKRSIVNDKVRIFCLTESDSDEGEIIDFIATTNKYSTSFFGELQISFNPTLEIKSFCDEMIIQIHKKGIKSLNSEFEWNSNEKEIVACSIDQENIVVILNDSTAVLFDKSLQVFVPEDQILALETANGKITDVTFCNSFVAVATTFDENSLKDKKSSLTIFSSEFDHVLSQIFLLSPIISLVFIPETQILYASTENGHVLSWKIESSGFIDSEFCSTIFINQDSSSYLTSIGNDLLIINDELFIYNGKQIMPIQIGSILSICTINEDCFFVLMKNREIFRVKINRDEKRLFKINEYNVSKPARRIACSDNLIISLSRTRDNSNSNLDIFNQTNFTQFIFDINSEQRFRFPPISMIEIPSKSCILVGLAKTDDENHLIPNSGSLFVLTVDGEKQTVSVVKQISVPGIPYSLKLFNDDEVFIGVNKSVYILSTKEWHLFEKEVAVVPTQTAFIDFFNESNSSDISSSKFVWIVDRTQSLFCFKSYENEVTQHSLLELVAVDTEQRQITAIAALNGHQVVIGDKFGCISVLRLPDCLLFGAATWGEMKPPERGAKVPEGVHIEKVATFSVGQAVTSLLVNKKNNLHQSRNIVFFYTTIFGQIGSAIQINSDDEFSVLYDAEKYAKKFCEEDFGFVHQKRFKDAEKSVVGTRFFEFIEETGHEIPRKIEEAINFPYQHIQNLICRYKTMTNF